MPIVTTKKKTRNEKLAERIGLVKFSDSAYEIRCWALGLSNMIDEMCQEIYDLSPDASYYDIHWSSGEVIAQHETVVEMLDDLGKALNDFQISGSI
tara:strand:- start:40 stop:327 length:288 start_codon:yes stop_codon:yes gene_type:complete